MLTLKTTRRYYRIDRRQIGFLRFLLEAYEGIAMLRTLDPGAGGVVLHIAPGAAEEVADLLDGLKMDVRIEAWPEGAALDDPGGGSQAVGFDVRRKTGS